ncbi:DoxX family protein [Mycolicibacterium sp. XJ870]
MDTTGRLAHRWQRRLLTSLCWLLAVAFVFGAVTKFLPGETFFGPPHSEKFVDWGYPAWFRFLVGSGELVGAALLLTPHRRFLGATLLATILIGAVATHLINQDPFRESVMAPVNLALIMAIAWFSRPATRNELRLRRQHDA